MISRLLLKDKEYYKVLIIQIALREVTTTQYYILFGKEYVSLPTTMTLHPFMHCRLSLASSLSNSTPSDSHKNHGFRFIVYCYRHSLTYSYDNLCAYHASKIHCSWPMIITSTYHHPSSSAETRNK